MTKNDFTELEKRRLNYMADNTPINHSNIPKLMKIAEKLKEEDTSLNIYVLYKHPEVRIKLFSQIIDACYMTLKLSPTQAQRLALYNYLEQQYESILKKIIANTDKQAMGDLLNALKLPTEIESQVIRDMAVSGLLDKE